MLINLLLFIVGLVHAENHHQLCRVLARIKSSHQLAQLTRVTDFERWIRLVCDFSCKTFQSWQWSPNSIYYLLSLWSRLVTASRNLKKEECSFISSCAISVVEVYISSRVESVVYLMRNPDQDGKLDILCYLLPPLTFGLQILWMKKIISKNNSKRFHISSAVRIHR